MVDVVISKDWYAGLGTQLCAFSTFLDIGVKNVFFYNESPSIEIFKEFKNIFGIPQNILEIKIYNDKDNFTETLYPGDHFKIFSPYYKIKKPEKRKPFIGLCFYNNEIPYPVVENYYGYPDVKFYTLNQYSNIIKLVKNSRYDIISLDSRDISIKEKAEIILEKCDAVIGYEGGVAHLCHMLDTPYIMLPWKNDPEMAPSLHLDTKTYFLENFDEILNWYPSDLQSCIRNLQQDNTNNKYVNGYPISTVLQKEATLTDEEKRFLSQKYLVNA